MLKFLEKYSISNVSLTTACQLKCSFCDLWKKESTFLNVPDLIKSGTYYDIYPRTPWVNVYGGDPFTHEDLRFILSFYKAEGVKVRLWTHGVVSLDAVSEIADVVDEVMVYIPTVVDEDYILITGLGNLSEVSESIRMLRSEKVSVTLHCPISVDTIGDLPDVHDFAFEHSVPLVFHYGKSHGLTKDQLSFVNRYRRVKNVFVRRNDFFYLDRCPALPVLKSGFWLNMWDDILFRCWNQSIV